MERILVFLIFSLFFCSNSFSQANEEPKEPSTKIGAFLAKKGKVLVKDFYLAGTLKGSYDASIEFSALVIYEPGRESERIRGLKIEISEGGRYERNHSSFLDMDEIDAFIKAVVTCPPKSDPF